MRYFWATPVLTRRWPSICMRSKRGVRPYRNRVTRDGEISVSLGKNLPASISIRRDRFPTYLSRKLGPHNLSKFPLLIQHYQQDQGHNIFCSLQSGCREFKVRSEVQSAWLYLFESFAARKAAQMANLLPPLFNIKGRDDRLWSIAYGWPLQAWSHWALLSGRALFWNKTYFSCTYKWIKQRSVIASSAYNKWLIVVKFHT